MKRAFFLLLALTGTLLAADPAPKVTEGNLFFKNPNLLFRTADGETVVGSTSKTDPLLKENGLVLDEFESAIITSDDGEVLDQSSLNLSGAENFKLKLMAATPVAVTQTITVVNGQPVIVWKLKK